jgi:polyhydroxyalkanoate synthesis regulator phasin
MKKLLEKGLLTSMGLLLLLHEKADEIIRDLVEKGRMAPEEGRRFLDELAIRIDREKEAIREEFGLRSKAVLREMGLVTRDDWEKLLKRIDKLEKKVAPAKRQATSKKTSAKKK